MSGTPEEDAAGGPAFPTDYHSECHTCKTEVYGATSHGGMTLRDYFAAHAPEPPESFWRRAVKDTESGEKMRLRMAAWRYEYADAMLAARRVSKENRAVE